MRCIDGSTYKPQRPWRRSHPRAVNAARDNASFAEGTQLRVEAVVWSTGFQPGYSWIEAPVLDAAGRVRHHRAVTNLPGRYFLGLYWQHTRGLALLGCARDDAEYIATQIQTLPGRRPQPATNGSHCAYPDAGESQEESDHAEPQ